MNTSYLRLVLLPIPEMGRHYLYVVFSFIGMRAVAGLGCIGMRAVAQRWFIGMRAVASYFILQVCLLRGSIGTRAVALLSIPLQLAFGGLFFPNARYRYEPAVVSLFRGPRAALMGTSLSMHPH